MNILLAEDEKSLSKATVHILEKHGYTVTAAYDGEEALNILAEIPHDLLILDVMMPKMDGMEVLKTLRSSGNNIKILMLTAKAEIDDKLEGLENDADDYMTKPFDYRELLARIKVLLKPLASQPEIEYRDIRISTEKKMMQNKEEETAVCGLTDEEIRIMKHLFARKEAKREDSVRLFGIDEERTSLYVRYLNNKLKRISSVLQITETDDSWRIEG